MNKTLTSWLSVVVVFLCLPLFAWNGSGTYEAPYEINTASDVADLVQVVNGGASQSGVYFLQTADIDLSSFGNFTPIGLPTAPFSGAYDGDGYILSNLTITANVPSTATTNAFGFFGYCKSATIENVSVYGKIDVSVSGYNQNALVAVGGIVGFAGLGNYVSLYNYCDIALSAPTDNADRNSGSNYSKICYAVGGVYGVLQVRNTNLTYYPCYNYGKISLVGGNGFSTLAGVANVVGPSSGGTQFFDGFKNFGSLNALGAVATSEHSTPVIGGVLNVHVNYSGAQNRHPILRYCENYGSICFTGAYHASALIMATGAYGSESTRADYSTNYANITAFLTDNLAEKVFVSGCVGFTGVYTDASAIGCVNLGDTFVDASKAGSGCRVHAAGIIVHVGGYAGSRTTSLCKNFGNISVLCSGIATIGGILAGEGGFLLSANGNYGDIHVDAPTAYVGGIGAQDHSSNYRHPFYLRNCANFGNIVSKRVVSGGIGGLIGGDNKNATSVSYDIHTTISNSYSLGTYNGDKSVYGAFIGCANVPTYAPTKIFNSYCLLNNGDSMVGYADTTKNSLIISNCTAIVNGSATFVGSIEGELIVYQSSLSNYSDIYHTPSVPNIFADTYTASYKSADYFDLILPINKTLFPVQTDEIISLHNWTKANDFKRYTRTIQQQ